MALSKPLSEGKVFNIPESSQTSISRKTWSKEQLIAYDAFLWSEELRHMEDVANIRKKRDLLHKCGYIASEVGPWITEEEIIDSMFNGD